MNRLSPYHGAFSRCGIRVIAASATKQCTPTGNSHDTMSLSQAQKKAFRSIGHHLNPVVTVSENGVSEGVMAELDRALNDHELIKIKLAVGDREIRRQVIDELASDVRAEVIQVIGKMALLYRRNPKANPKLSNVKRFEAHHGRH